MAISFAAVLDVLPASDCPRYTQKYLFPSSVSANPVNHASRECETFSVNNVLEGLLW